MTDLIDEKPAAPLREKWWVCPQCDGAGCEPCNWDGAHVEKIRPALVDSEDKPV